LVELLVVLAILVLLFGLLFAPMMTSLDMAKEGQIRARMQDTARQAMEDIQRTVTNAIHVLPVRVVTPTTAPTLAYVNTSQLAVILPVPGSLTSPPQPPTRPDPTRNRNWIEAVRYAVHPYSGRIVRSDDVGIDLTAFPPGTTAPMSLSQPTTGLEYTPSYEDPFILYRQVGILFEVPQAQAEYGFGGRWFRFGSLVDDGTGNLVFYSNRPETENALTLAGGYDVPCSTSVCDNCGARYPGFRAYGADCASCGTAAGYTYLFDSVRFTPVHAANEQLQSQRDGTEYRAEHGAWTGYVQGSPTTVCPRLFPAVMDPRVTVWRYNSTTGAYTDLQYDSYDAALRGTPQFGVAWDADKGTVKFGRTYTQTVTLTESGGTVSTLVGSDEATVTPLDPPGPTAPNGYRIDPTPNAIILPDTVTMRAVANLSGGTIRWIDYAQTQQLEQDQIGEWQFAVKRELPPANWASWIPENWALSMDLLFNNLEFTGPPGPAKFAAALGVPVSQVSNVELQIEYWARRNADIFAGGSATPTARDDLVRVDYNTRGLIDLNLTLSEFAEYEEDATNTYVLPPPPPKRQQVALHDTLVVRNAGG
jgi:type II secretory pathway pseudopilin PulG